MIEKNFMKKLAILIITMLNIFANMSPEGFERFPNTYFVETGTYCGQGVVFAIRAGFPEIHSIEIDHSLVLKARSLFRPYRNIHIWEGNSGTMLWEVIKNINKQITFWLDGHNSTLDPNRTEKNTPLMEELEQIRWHHIKTHTILIDDMHCCATMLFDFLTKEEIKQKIREINPNYTITFVDGGSAGEYKNNIMVAYVQSERI